MLLSFFSRLFRTAPGEPATVVEPQYRACDESPGIARPFSPLIKEMMALYCHTRVIRTLSQAEACPDEYLMTARSVIHHILQGWQSQTEGCGTIDDLLVYPRTFRLTHVEANAAHARPATDQFRQAR
ncbi:hypothetical protein ACFXJ6_25920 [Streptomyces sp. NPDC059218]|uniref:hypothetical protein n=1 Tax=unclassified Streptomyces TaxID=2593676 RepID=UPI00369B0321